MIKPEITKNTSTPTRPLGKKTGPWIRPTCIVATPNAATNRKS
jgi:hypothetical protein